MRRTTKHGMWCTLLGRNDAEAQRLFRNELEDIERQFQEKHRCMTHAIETVPIPATITGGTV